MKEWQDNLQHKTDEIADTLIALPADLHKPGLLDGQAGQALFLLYHARHTGNNASYERGRQILDEVVKELLERRVALTSLCSGIAGIGWVLQHITDEQLTGTDHEPVLKDIDAFLCKALYKQAEHWDYLHGSLGIAFYLLKRLPHNKSIRNHLERYLSYFLSLATVNPDGSVKWGNFSQYKGKVIFSISLAHGLCAIISLLLRFASAGIEKEVIHAQVYKALQYILQQQMSEDFISRYPSYSLESDDPLLSSRMGWCHGDMGTGITLLRAAHALNDTALLNEGMDTLLNTTRRRSLQENYVADAALCHGAAGIAHIYRKWAALYNQPAFADAASYWYQAALSMGNIGSGYAGYKMFFADTGEWRNNAGVLEGVAGIGLSFLSQLQPGTDGWDECLLLYA